jgi:hypothetical protein
MTSTVSTTVKIVVSMVVVAALVATTFNSKVRTMQKNCSADWCGSNSENRTIRVFYSIYEYSYSRASCNP